MNDFEKSILRYCICGDTKLKDWYREYICKKNDQGNWVFYGFGGEMNFTGENFTPEYLK